MPAKTKHKKKKAAHRKAGGPPRGPDGQFLPRPGLKKKAQDHHEHMARCRLAMMKAISESSVAMVITRLIQDCDHEDPIIRLSAIRIFLDKATGRTPMLVETKDEKTIRFVKEIVLTTPEKATPPARRIVSTQEQTT